MIEHQDAIDFSRVIESRGIGTGVRWILGIGIVMIFTIGGFTAFLSGHGHMWPATHTMRMDLGSMPK
ncbi:MAG TPA: hypothetical protein VMV65_10780 [Alphaproteobacteria bacterium]|nr:hypothetical protein [Alphaproteobacteria bacterium]